MQTLRLGSAPKARLPSGDMPKSKRAIEVVPTGPLAQYFADKGHGEKRRIAKILGYVDQQVITNWLSRGNIPLAMFPAVCKAIGLTEDQYRARAGLTIRGRLQGEIDAPTLLADFEKLPAGLRAYVAKKARELHEIWEQNPILHEVFTPPKDPARYAQWEKDIEALIYRLRPGGQEDHDT